MPVERRGWVIAFEIGSTGNGRNRIFNGSRQPPCGGTSRMTRECQVRICERLGVKFPGPTRPTRTFRNVRFPASRDGLLDRGRMLVAEKVDHRESRGAPRSSQFLLQNQQVLKSVWLKLFVCT